MNDRCSHYIPAAAYRSHGGQWLSRSSAAPHNTQRVCTLRESDLLAALADGLPTEQLRLGTECTAVEPATVNSAAEAGALRLHLSDGTHIDGATLVIADGAGSALRRTLFPTTATQEADDTGLVSFSGILEERSLPEGIAEPLAFETLSGGARFALVPLSRGGCFWFATLNRDTVERALAKAQHAALGRAGSAGPENAPPGAIGAVRELFRGWHAPIKQVLHAAACAAAEEGLGGGTGGTGGMGGTTTGSAFRVERIWSRRASGGLSGRWWEGRAVLVGDAAHAMPINLAQGG